MRVAFLGVKLPVSTNLRAFEIRTLEMPRRRYKREKTFYIGGPRLYVPSRFWNRSMHMTQSRATFSTYLCGFAALALAACSLAATPTPAPAPAGQQAQALPEAPRQQDAAAEQKDPTSFILTPPDSPAPRINGARVFGVRPGSPFLYTIAATGTRPMTFSATGLPKGLKLDPETGRITRQAHESGRLRRHAGRRQRPGHGQRVAQNRHRRQNRPDTADGLE